MAEKTEKKKGFFAKIKGFFLGIVKYFRDTISEMKKVAWPTKKQIINNTIVVLIVVIAAAILIFALDTAFGAALKGVLQFAK